MNEEIVVHWDKFPKLTDFVRVINESINIFKTEPNIVKIQSPLTIFGDLHGNFNDLLHFLKNKTNNSKFVFLGDYVDRGSQSLEILYLLLKMKVKYPDIIVMIRGNHEYKSINYNYGFFHECKKKYPYSNIWELCNSLFETLPIACIVDEKYFCIHGGVTSNISLNDILKCNRFSQDCDEILQDLLWSDPHNDTGLQFNSTRGCGKLYGPDVSKQFLYLNHLEKIIRGHECERDGYKWWHDGRVLTIFSTSNYSGNNLSAVLKIENGNLFIKNKYMYL